MFACLGKYQNFIAPLAPIFLLPLKWNPQTVTQSLLWFILLINLLYHVVLVLIKMWSVDVNLLVDISRSSWGITWNKWNIFVNHSKKLTSWEPTYVRWSERNTKQDTGWLLLHRSGLYFCTCSHFQEGSHFAVFSHYQADDTTSPFDAPGYQCISITARRDAASVSCFHEIWGRSVTSPRRCESLRRPWKKKKKGCSIYPTCGCFQDWEQCCLYGVVLSLSGHSREWLLSCDGHCINQFWCSRLAM